uniref:Putative secreted protein n=1 Tax=Ixodes ricinus TaxID=34613 RepID=A0A6B0UGS7_IXORI
MFNCLVPQQLLFMGHFKICSGLNLFGGYVFVHHSCNFFSPTSTFVHRNFTCLLFYYWNHCQAWWKNISLCLKKFHHYFKRCKVKKHPPFPQHLMHTKPL